MDPWTIQIFSYQLKRSDNRDYCNALYDQRHCNDWKYDNEHDRLSDCKESKLRNDHKSSPDTLKGLWCFNKLVSLRDALAHNSTNSRLFDSAGYTIY